MRNRRRTFRAPRELVYQAWTDPALFTRWWGATCFINPVCEVDLRRRLPGDRSQSAPGGFERSANAVGSVLMTGVVTVVFDGEGNSTPLTLRAAANAESEMAARMLEMMLAGCLESLQALA